MRERARSTTKTEGTPAAAPRAGDDHHLTDLGNARRLVGRHGADLRYVHPWKSWHVWDGRRWTEDSTGEATRRIKETFGAALCRNHRSVEGIAGFREQPRNRGRPKASRKGVTPRIEMGRR